jgi:hypothetical protein
MTRNGNIRTFAKKVHVPAEHCISRAPFELNNAATLWVADEAIARGWTVVSIKDDWGTIHPPKP